MIRDDEFYDEILRPIEEQMMACVWRVTQNHAASQDALQDALVVIWQKRKKIINHPVPQALVLKICREKAIDCLRKSIRKTERELPLTLSEGAETVPVGQTQAYDELHTREVMGQVCSVIASLPRKRSQAVLMRLVEGDSYEAIALVLDCSEATVRSHIRRGMECLRNKLKHLAGGSDL